MKKLLCIVCCLSLLAATGCNLFKKGNKPEDVGKKHVEERFKGEELDVSNLEYTVLEQTEDTAVVRISGAINFYDEIRIVKEDKMWKMEAAPQEKKTVH